MDSKPADITALHHKRGLERWSRPPEPRGSRGGGAHCCCNMPATIPTARACWARRRASCAPSRNFSPATTRTRSSSWRAPSRRPTATTRWWCCKDIRFESHCEHHIAPIIGKAHVAYLPATRVVGISKLARLVEVYAKRLQIQEKMTAQIANTLDEVLRPKGVAVVIEAAHQCMTTRGVHKPGVAMVTSRMLGAFRNDVATRREFLAIIGAPGGAAATNV